MSPPTSLGLEGKFDIPEFLEEQSGYISTLKTWLALHPRL